MAWKNFKKFNFNPKVNARGKPLKFLTKARRLSRRETLEVFTLKSNLNFSLFSSRLSRESLTILFLPASPLTFYGNLKIIFFVKRISISIGHRVTAIGTMLKVKIKESKGYTNLIEIARCRKIGRWCARKGFPMMMIQIKIGWVTKANRCI